MNVQQGEYLSTSHHECWTISELSDNSQQHLRLHHLMLASLLAWVEVPWQGKPVSAGSWAAMLRKLVSALNEGHVWRLSQIANAEATKIMKL